MQRAAGHDDLFGLYPDRSLGPFGLGTADTTKLVPRGPQTLHSDGTIGSTATFVKKHLRDVEAFDEPSAGSGGGGQPTHGWALLLGRAAPEATASAVVFCSAAIDRTGLGICDVGGQKEIGLSSVLPKSLTPAKPSRTLEDHSTAVGMPDIGVGHAHEVAHAVETFLEFICDEKVQPLVRPLLPHVSLGLEADAPLWNKRVLAATSVDAYGL